MNKIKNKETFLLIGSSVGIMICIALICGTNLFRFNYRMNADIASDAILGKLIWESRQIIPDTWYRANETRIICMPNLAALIFGITGNMNLSAGLACCIITIMVLGSIIYFCKLIGIKKAYSALAGFLCLSLPFGPVMQELLYMFACYYSGHVIIFFVTLAIYVEVIKNRKLMQKGVKLAVGILMAFVLGLQGVRGILVIYGPLFGMEIIRNIYISYSGQRRERHDICLSIWTAALLAVSFAGTCFPFSVGQGFSRNIRKGFYKLFTVVIPDMGQAIGFSNSGTFGKLFLGLLLSVTLCILIYILWKMWKKKFVDPIEWAWLIICSSPVVTAFMVAFTTVESTERYYFMLPFLLAFSVVLLFEKNLPYLKYAMLISAISLAFINIYQMYVPMIYSNEPPDSEKYRVVEFLKEMDYPLAYASFENANTMTVLSNGEICVYPVATVEKMNICKWMSSTEWYCPNAPFEQKTAYVISEAQEEEFNRFLKGKEELVYEVNDLGWFKIYASDYNFSNLEE